MTSIKENYPVGGKREECNSVRQNSGGACHHYKKLSKFFHSYADKNNKIRNI
jgi:hypothetical protein